MLRARYWCKVLRWACLCLSLCVCTRSHISKITRRNSTTQTDASCARYVVAACSVILWRPRNSLRISDLVEHVIFHITVSLYTIRIWRMLTKWLTSWQHQGGEVCYLRLPCFLHERRSWTVVERPRGTLWQLKIEIVSTAAQPFEKLQNSYNWRRTMMLIQHHRKRLGYVQRQLKVRAMVYGGTLILLCRSFIVPYTLSNNYIVRAYLKIKKTNMADQYARETSFASHCQILWRSVILLWKYRNFSRFLAKCKNSLNDRA